MAIDHDYICCCIHYDVVLFRLVHIDGTNPDTLIYHLKLHLRLLKSVIVRVATIQLFNLFRQILNFVFLF